MRPLRDEPATGHTDTVGDGQAQLARLLRATRPSETAHGMKTRVRAALVASERAPSSWSPAAWMPRPATVVGLLLVLAVAAVAAAVMVSRARVESVARPVAIASDVPRRSTSTETPAPVAARTARPATTPVDDPVDRRSRIGRVDLAPSPERAVVAAARPTGPRVAPSPVAPVVQPPASLPSAPLLPAAAATSPIVPSSGSAAAAPTVPSSASPASRLPLEADEEEDVPVGRPVVTVRAPSSQLVADAMTALRVDRDPAGARLLLDRFSALHPNQLVEEVLGLQIEAAAAQNDRRAADRAAEYLRRFPNGSFAAAALRAIERFRAPAR